MKMTTAQTVKAISLADSTWNKAETIEYALSKGGEKEDMADGDGDYKIKFKDGSFVYFYGDNRSITEHFKDEY